MEGCFWDPPAGTSTVTCESTHTGKLSLSQPEGAVDGLVIVVEDFVEADHVIAGGLAVTKLLVSFLLVAAILIQTEGRLSRRRRLSGLEGRRLLVGAR